MVTNNLQQAIVLHTRAHGENTYICQLMTERDGRITGFVRRSSKQDSLTPFNLYLVSCVQGQGDLFFVNQSELLTRLDTLAGSRLFSGLYINELLSKLLHQVLAPEQCLEWYLTCIRDLQDESVPLEPVLRSFELDLINELGLAPDYFHCAATHETLLDNSAYCFVPDSGWLPVADFPEVISPVFKGHEVKAIGMRDWQDPHILKQTKLFMRWWLDILLAGKPLKSRSLFRQK